MEKNEITTEKFCETFQSSIEKSKELQQAYQKAAMNMSLDYIEPVQIPNVQKFLEVRTCYKYLKSPRLASYDHILAFLDVLKARNVLFMSQERIDEDLRAEMFHQYASVLSQKIYRDALPEILDYITCNHKFLPTICEILQAQKQFENRFYRFRSILEKSLNQYWLNCSDEDLEKLAREMQKQDGLISKSNSNHEM